MTHELPDLPYAKDALGALHLCRDPGVSTTTSTTPLT